jgi:hypothetical protein
LWKYIEHPIIIGCWKSFPGNERRSSIKRNISLMKGVMSCQSMVKLPVTFHGF